MPSSSLSGSGQPSSSWKPSLSSGSSRALVDVVGDAVAVAVAGPGRRVLGDALVLRRLVDRELRVGLGDLGLAARVVVVAFVERVLREVVVRLGHRELDRRARCAPLSRAVAISPSVAVVCARTVEPAQPDDANEHEQRELHGVVLRRRDVVLRILRGRDLGLRRRDRRSAWPCGRLTGARRAGSSASAFALLRGLGREPAEVIRALEVGVRGDLARHVQVLRRARPPVRRVLVGLAARAASTASRRLQRDLADVRDRPAAASEHDDERPRRIARASYHRDSHAPAVAPELDRDVDRRAEQREQRHHERPAELDREQRDALAAPAQPR